MKNTPIIDHLDKEAERFKQLAKDHALKSLLNGGDTEAAQTAKNHLIRAETYKDAARIVTGRGA